MHVWHCSLQRANGKEFLDLTIGQWHSGLHAYFIGSMIIDHPIMTPAVIATHIGTMNKVQEKLSTKKVNFKHAFLVCHTYLYVVCLRCAC